MRVARRERVFLRLLSLFIHFLRWYPHSLVPLTFSISFSRLVHRRELRVQKRIHLYVFFVYLGAISSGSSLAFLVSLFFLFLFHFLFFPPSRFSTFSVFFFVTSPPLVPPLAGVLGSRRFLRAHVGLKPSLDDPQDCAPSRALRHFETLEAATTTRPRSPAVLLFFSFSRVLSTRRHLGNR